MAMASEMMLLVPERLGRKAAKKIAFLAFRISEKTCDRSGGSGDLAVLVVCLVLGEYQSVTVVPSSSLISAGGAASCVRIGCAWELEVDAPGVMGATKWALSSSSRCQYVLYWAAT